MLACIPLRGSVPFKDIAELVEVPETQLCQIVRMTATAGFLHEPRPSHVAHSALSRLFVTKPSYLDAAMFLSETAAPAALHMAAATQRFRQSKQPHESAYNIAHNTSATFASVYEQQPKLQRQWLAYLRYAVGEEDSSVTDVLTCFDWLSLGNAVVVEVSLDIFDSESYSPFFFCFSMAFSVSFATSLAHVWTLATLGGRTIECNSTCSRGLVPGTSLRRPDE